MKAIPHISNAYRLEYGMANPLDAYVSIRTSENSVSKLNCCFLIYLFISFMLSLCRLLISCQQLIQRLLLCLNLVKGLDLPFSYNREISPLNIVSRDISMNCKGCVLSRHLNRFILCRIHSFNAEKSTYLVYSSKVNDNDDDGEDNATISDKKSV